MNAEILLKYFDRISDAPDAIPRLRQFILDLAVRGGLVEQDPNDEPADTLLAQLTNRAGPDYRHRRKSETLPAITSGDIPFALPPGWAWERLGNVGETNIGLTYSPQDVSDVGIPVLRSSNIQNGKLDFDDLVRVQTEPKPSVMVQDGDLLICARNGSRALVGKVAVIENLNEPAAFGAFMAIFRSVMNKYLYHFICSPLFRQMIDEVNTTTINQITQNNLRSTLAPIPPLAEQHRIVAKVAELMKLCDQLEEAQRTREARRDRLAAASLHRLNNGAEGETLREHARFFINHLPRSTARPDQIRDFRQTVLNLAVRGTLVPRDPHDEPANTLLLQSDTARQVVAQSDRRADPDRQQLLAVELKWAIPSTWEWSALADLVLFIDYRGKTPDKVERGVRLITAKNVRKGFISLSPEEFLTEAAYHAWMTRGLPKVGDLLFTTEAPMGNAAVVRMAERFALAQRVICFRPYASVDAEFLALQFLSEPFQAILDNTATGLTAKGVKGAKLKRLPVAIPPLAEQHRIVAKVNELMAVCDCLETQLTAMRTGSGKLLEAVLHKTLAPAATEAL